MADKKITELTELTTVLAQTDMIVVVDDPGGSPVTKKQQKRNLQTRYVALEPFGMKVAEACATGSAKAGFHIPPDLDGLNLIYCHAEVKVAGTTGVMQIQVRNATQTADMLVVTDPLEVDTGETGSDTAANPYDIDEANDDVSTNDWIQLDFDTLHSTPAQGCLVTLGFG